MFITFVEDRPASKLFHWATMILILFNAFICFKTVRDPDFLGILGRYGFIPAAPFRNVGFFTAVFLHSSWSQLVANMGFLFMFGRAVEERIGALRFLAVFFLCTWAGQLVHWYFHPNGVLALVGASRAVTGMGVLYLFFHPWGKMKWIFQFFGVPFLEIPSRTAYVLGLWGGMLAAMAFMPWSKLAWLTIPLNKLGWSLFTIIPTAGIAWHAHLGALAMGLCLYFLFPQKKGKSR